MDRQVEGELPSEDDLSKLIERFYAAVREDAQIGHVFNAAVEDWPEHLDRMNAFWSSVMLTSGRYKGNPMALHVRHASLIKPEMFDRWLSLWREHAMAMLRPHAAAEIIARAERIAESLKRGLFFRLPPKSSAAA